MLRAALPILFILVLASCAPWTTRPVGEPVSQAFAEQLLSGWSASAGQVTSLRGLAQIKVEAPINSLSGSQVLIAEKPGHVRAETLSAFGAPLLVLASDGTRLGVSIPPENLYYTGAATADNIVNFIKVPLSPEDLVDVLLYQPKLLRGWKEEAFTLREGGWLLIRHGTLQRQELVFNTLRQLVEVSFFDHNDLLLKVRYGRFQDLGGPFPHQMSLEVPSRFTTVSLEFSDLETNAPLRPGLFQLSPPPGARVVYLSNG